MGKKASRRRHREEFPEHSKVRALIPASTGWSPLQKNGSEQSYTRHVRPCSDNQRRLLEAIDKRNLVVAVGPAGTGKTFLAIAKAVEAFRKAAEELIQQIKDAAGTIPIPGLRNG